MLKKLMKINETDAVFEKKIVRQTYADKILTAVNELDKLFDEFGQVKKDVGKLVIHEMRKAFDFTEVAGYTVDLIAAKKDENIFCVDCWGAENYLSVKQGRNVPITDVKKFFVLYMLGRRTGDFSKLTKLMPRWREYLEKGYFSVIENEKGEVLMFNINYWPLMNDRDGVLDMEMLFQFGQDLLQDIYKGIDQEYFRQISFIVLYQNDERIDTVMARNLLGSHEQKKFLPIYPEDQNELMLFIKALEIIIAQYQKKLNEINNLNQINGLMQKGFDITRLIEHQLRNPLISLNGYAQLIKKRADSYINKKISEESFFDFLTKYSEIIMNSSKEMEYWLSIAKNLYNDVFEQNQVDFNVLELIEAKVSDLLNKYKQFGITIELINPNYLINKELRFYGAKNVFYSLLSNIFENAFKYTKALRQEKKLKSRNKSRIMVMFKLEESPSVFCNESILEISVSNPGPFISQEFLDRKVSSIVKEEETGPDSEREALLKEAGFNTNGVGLSKSVGAVLKKGGSFNMYSIPDGGVNVVLRMFVNLTDKEPL
jgi:signal transduction histidine kinase